MKIIKLFLLSVIAFVNLSFFAFAEEEKLRDVRMVFHVKDGEPKWFGQSGMDIDAEDTTVSKMQDSNEFYWEIKEDDSIAFTFPLGKNSKEINATLSCYSTGNKSEVQIRCNGQKLKTIKFDKAGTFEEQFTFTPQPNNNTLKVKATEGTIGITRLVIDCQEPYPTFEFDNGVKFTLMSPEPDVELGATNEVKFVWKAFGNYETGWMKLEYRNKDNTQWQSVPGAEGFSPNSENWKGEKGEYTWNNLPKSTDFDFRIEFKTGKNTVEEEKIKVQKTKKIEAKIFSELAKVKWDYLSKAYNYIEKDLWQKYAKENYDKARKLRKNLEDEFEEKNKDEIKNQDEIKQNLDQLDALYFKALSEVLSNLSQEKDLSPRNRERISKSEEFIEAWEDAINDANKIIQKNFANETTIAKEISATLFSQERFENLKKKIKEIKYEEDKKISDKEKEKVLFNELIKIKWRSYLAKIKSYIDKDIWHDNASKDYNAIKDYNEARRLENELDKVFKEEDKEINDIAKIKQDMAQLETFYFAAVINMIKNLPNTENIAPGQYESIKSNAKKIIEDWTRTKANAQEVIRKRTNDDAKIAENVYAQLFPNEERFENLKNVIKPTVEPQPQTFNLAGTWIYENNTLAVSQDGRLTVFDKDPNTDLPPKYKTYYYTYNQQTGDIVTEDRNGKKTNIKIQWINKDKFNWTSQYGTKIYTRYINKGFDKRVPPSP
jgi:hypothetical protein